MGLGTWVGFLFGTPFLAVGIAIFLVGTRTISVEEASIHAPYWVLGVAGISFFLAGILVWSLAFKQLAHNRRRARAARQFPGEPALADYPWHPEGFGISPSAGVVKTAAFALGMTLFLSMFNWWAFVAHGPWMVKAIVILFDAAALALWCQAGLQLGRALKFGSSRVLFTRFPYRLGEPVVLRWQPLGGVAHVRKGTFTLRCVEEWMERSDSDSSHLVHEQLWSATWFVDQPRNLQLREAAELQYELPPDAQPTALSAHRPVFWELEVKLDLPGLDFKETYLVPIYGVKSPHPAMALT